MSMVTVSDWIKIFGVVADRMAAERDNLCELDGHIGDADHGIAMAQGFAAVKEALAEIESGDANLRDVMNTTAKSFLNAVGASTGPLYATAFMRGGKWAGDRVEVSVAEMPGIFVAMTEGIVARGKAEPGEKTMLDTWHLAAEAVERGNEFSAISVAAEKGAESTRNMLATKGRAARLGERSLGHLDPGAVSAAMIITTILDELTKLQA